MLLNNTPHSSVHLRKWKVPTLPQDCRSLTIRSKTLSCYCTHMHTVRKIVVNVIHNVHNVYILSTRGWERNMQGDSGWGLSRLLSHKRSCNQEPRFDYQYLNCYHALKCLLYCNTTKRFRVQRNCDYAYLCVYSTHIWHLKCNGHGCQHISPHYISGRLIFSHLRQVQVKAVKSSLPSCCD